MILTGTNQHFEAIILKKQNRTALASYGLGRNQLGKGMMGLTGMR